MPKTYTKKELATELAVIHAQTEVLRLMGEQRVAARMGQKTSRFSFGELAI